MLGLLFLCLVLSIGASVAATLAFERHREVLPDLIRTKQFEVVDGGGRVLIRMAGVKHGNDPAVPVVTLLDADGRDSITMAVDPRGDGILNFASDRWHGTIVLGHLVMVDDETQSKSRDVPDTSGAWGMRVRSPDNKFTYFGFLNSGKPMVPLQEEAKH